MSALLMGQAFYAPLSMQEKLTLLALCDHANDDGSHVFAGQARLAAKVGCSERSIRRAVTALVAAGYLLPAERHGSHGTNHYTVNTEKLAALDRTVVADRPNWPTGQMGSKLAVDRTSTTRRPDIAVSAKPSVEPKEKSTPRKTRLPSDFPLTETMRGYAVAQGCQDPGRLHEDFGDYWQSRGVGMLDWGLVWKRWVRSAHDGTAKPCGCAASAQNWRGGAPLNRRGVFVG